MPAVRNNFVSFIRGHSRRTDGFTLVELSFVVLISGLILATFVMVGKQMYAVQQEERSDRVMNNSKELLDNFYAASRRYPCPADPTLTPGDALFGVEDCSAARRAAATGANASVLVGTFPQKVSLSGGAAPYYSVRSLGRPLSNDNLQFDNRDAVKNDFTSAWGDQLTYAVTERLTSLATFSAALSNFKENAGSVIINDDFGNPITTNAHYTIVSHGENRRICPPVGGAVVIPGAPPPPPPTSEQENCDGDDQFVSGIHRGVQGATHYDDEIRYARFADLNYWQGNGTEMTAINLPGAGDTTRVGIGVSVPEQRLHVNGEIRVDSYARSDRICSRDGTKCINLALLENIQCVNPGEYMRGLTLDNMGNVTPDCEEITAIPASAPVPNCPPGSFLQGFLTTGGASGRICNTPPP